MIEALEKIQAIIKESTTFALLSKKNCEDYKLLAKSALEKALLEKNLGVVSLPEYPEFKNQWGAILPEQKNSPTLCQTSIRIPKNQHKVKELNYENNEDFLNLVITTENGEIDKNNIIFEPILPKADAVFCFFEPNEFETSQNSEQEIILPEKEKIIFFSSNGLTYAEKISQIIKVFAPETFSLKEISTLLFASLVSETNNFDRSINQEVLFFGSELLSHSADKERVKEILNKGKNLSFAQLLGRGLARTHINETSPASWTFLSADDLKKTRTTDISNAYFYNILCRIRNNIPRRLLSFLFWQNNQNIYAIVGADEEKELMPIANIFGVKLHSKYFIAGPFNNFSEAELKFRNVLKEMLSLKI